MRNHTIISIRAQKQPERISSECFIGQPFRSSNAAIDRNGN